MLASPTTGLGHREFLQREPPVRGTLGWFIHGGEEPVAPVGSMSAAQSKAPK